MAIVEKGRMRVISGKGEADLSRASISKDLSGVGYDSDGKFFFITLDKVLFSDPVATIKTVLDAHGFVPNLENILSCLDSFVFGAYARTPAKGHPGVGAGRVAEYSPCLRFELPQKNRIGPILQSYYDELSRYESQVVGDAAPRWLTEPDAKQLKDLKAQVQALKQDNQALQAQVSALTLQLSREQKSLSRASRALDSQRVLPDNVRICKVEHVDLKRRMVKVSCYRKGYDVPTHLLDRVPEPESRCLIVFDDAQQLPVSVIFLEGTEPRHVERRLAELLHIEGDTFKARDAKRNEIQVKAVNELEAATIRRLRRGMQAMLSISDGYVVRFAVLESADPAQFTTYIHEQFIIHDIGRIPLVAVPPPDTE